MTPARLNVAHAVTLAQRPEGVTAVELSKAATCSLRAAQKTLAALTRDGVLVAEVPERKGRELGDWRTVYRLAMKGGAPSGGA